VSSSSGEPFAWFGGRLATGLADVTADLSALDRSGWWAVVVDFEGRVRCARFADVREAALPPGRWTGVPVDAWASSMTREQYVAAVGVVRDGIAVGDHYQVNICRVLTIELPSGTAPAAISGLAALLAEGNPAPYAGVVHLPALDVSVVSASPELFLSRDGDLVTSGPIKGTARTRDGLTDKDRAENVMIVDLVRNDLGAVAVTGSVEVPALCAVEEHPGLVHLVSRVSARLRAGSSCWRRRSRPGRSPGRRSRRPWTRSARSSRCHAAPTVARWAGWTPTGGRPSWRWASARSGRPAGGCTSGQVPGSPGGPTRPASGTRRSSRRGGC
jgi:para-aminobenzoate synthetase component 1